MPKSTGRKNRKSHKKSFVDSLIYDFIKEINPPQIPKAEYKKLIGDLAERETYIFAIAEKAKDHMLEGEFSEAAKLWEKAAEIVPSEDYFLQQQALSVCKSKMPSEDWVIPHI